MLPRLGSIEVIPNSILYCTVTVSLKYYINESMGISV